MDIITRAEAGLPRPPSTLTRHTGPWPGITWHHTGGSYTTWKSIHDWQVSGRPEASQLPYCGYSYGISRGRVTELRGWDIRPAGDHDNDRLQVCFMGTWDNRLPPAEDLAAAREFLAWATARNGRALPGVPHRDVWPAGHRYDTDCPGDALTAWLRDHLTEGDDMFEQRDRDVAWADTWRTFGLLSMAPTIEYLIPGEKTKRVEANRLAVVLNNLTAQLAAGEARDKATLAAIQALAENGGADVAPVLAAIDAVRAELGEEIGQLQAALAAAAGREAELQARLAAALAPTEG